MSQKLPITEDLDFAYLLELMGPLHEVGSYAWLPELFAIVGHESLINLCRYAGGETITIPTLEELEVSIAALQRFYDIQIAHREVKLPKSKKVQKLYHRICEIYNARTSDVRD